MRRFRKLVFPTSIVLAAAIAAGCGGNGSKPQIASFTASPAALPRGGGPVTFQWSATHARSFTIEPFVGAVSGTSATFVVTTGATFTLSARNASGFDRAQTTVTVGAPMTVSGAVYEAVRGNIPGLSVFVLGQDDVLPVVTTGDGSFTLDGVVAPYDLVVASTIAPVAFEYRGVTRPDPFVVLPFDPITLPAISAPPSTASASGTLSGVTFPLTGTQFVIGEAFGTRVLPTSSVPNAGSGDWTCTSMWVGPPAIDQTCSALVGSGNAGGDPDYRFGSRVETLPAGAVSTGETITLTSIPTRHVTGTASTAAGIPLVPFPAIRLAPAIAFDIPIDFMSANLLVSSTGASYSWGIPALPQGGSYALFETSMPGSNVIEAFRLESGARDLVESPAPTQELPLPGTQIDLSSRFARALPPGVIGADFFTFGAGQLYVLSAEPQFTLDDVGAGELGLAPQTAPSTVTWQSLGFGMFGSMDEALDPAGPSGDLYFGGNSTPRGFQLVP